MKLPNFRNDNGLNYLRSQIWADLNHDFNPYSSWDPLAVKLINEGELDWLKLSDVKVANDGTLEYAWIKIVVYIRDQHSKGFNFDNETSNYKFHFYNCGTISWYRKDWKFDWKYVANRSKRFHVNLIDYWEIIRTNLELDLNVCKQCLQCFHYKWYVKHSGLEEKNIYNNFTRKEYFESFKSKVSIPKHNHISKPLDIYPENWKQISLQARKRTLYKCEDCWLDVLETKKWLHVHHLDHNKWNNSPSNHRVVCIACHNNYHNHSII